MTLLEWTVYQAGIPVGRGSTRGPDSDAEQVAADGLSEYAASAGLHLAEAAGLTCAVRAGRVLLASADGRDW